VAGEEPSPRVREGLTVGHLHLHVGDIQRALGFYRDVLGFELRADLGSAAFVSAGGYHHHLGMNVWQGRGVGPAPAHTAGLREWTGRAAVPGRRGGRPRAAAGGGHPRRGPAGRASGPDPWETALAVGAAAGSGAMSAADRPQGPIEPVARAPRPIDPRVTIGHVHLRTADIDRVRAFYVGILGWDVVAEARDVPGWGTTGDLLFLSAGGYHHHLGFNTWKSAGGGPTPDGVAGLHHVAFNYPTRAALADAVARLRDADWPLRQASDHGTHLACTSRIPTATTSSSCGTARRSSGPATRTATPRSPWAPTSTSTRCWRRPRRRTEGAGEAGDVGRRPPPVALVGRPPTGVALQERQRASPSIRARSSAISAAGAGRPRR
jgi:catechol 2,3-dioxygenase